MDLKEHIRSVPDFPRAGILFYDITTLLRDPQGFKTTVDLLATPYAGQQVEVVVGIESRGFILGAAVAVSEGRDRACACEGVERVARLGAGARRGVPDQGSRGGAGAVERVGRCG